MSSSERPKSDANTKAPAAAKPPALRISARLTERRPADERLLLAFDMRSRSRFRAALSSGEECAAGG